MSQRDPSDARDALDGPSAATPQAYEFGPYRLELPTRRLLRGGAAVPLTPKAFDVLHALIERRERVVDKAELMRLVWPDSVVEEANLSQTIFVLRKTLGEGPAGRPFIDTVPRRGYRFAAAVREEVAKPATGPEAPAGMRPRARWIAAAVALTAAGIAWFGAPGIRRRSASTSGVESLVVLPFENLSGDTAQDYLADGMTDALITNLGQISGMRVISRTSAMTYKGARKTLPEIARELGVDVVVEGAVQRSGERVRLNLKLIQASTDRPLWAHSFERPLQDVLELQNDVARAIVSQTTVALTPRERTRLAEAPRVKPKVYEAYLKGRYFWNRRGEPDVRKAIEHFQEALRHEPDYAPAYAGLADSYMLLANSGWTVPGREAWQRAISAADKAIELDESLADGHTSRAAIAMHYEWDWTKAEKSFRRALELNPGYATARHWYGYQLMLMGRLEEAETELRRALELDPLSPIINANVGFRLYLARQYDAAIAHWRSALEMHPGYRHLRGYMGMAYVGKKRYTEAAAELEKGLALAGAGASDMAVLAHTFARMGRTNEARTLLSRLLGLAQEGSASAYYIALVYVGLGDKESAFEWLERAYRERSGPLNELNADPMFDPLRGDPRFTVLVRRMGLTPSAAPPPR